VPNSLWLGHYGVVKADWKQWVWRLCTTVHWVTCSHKQRAE